MNPTKRLEQLAKEAFELDLRTKRCWDQGMQLVEEMSQDDLILLMKRLKNCSSTMENQLRLDNIIHLWCVATKNTSKNNISMAQIVHEVYGDER